MLSVNLVNYFYKQDDEQFASIFTIKEEKELQITKRNTKKSFYIFYILCTVESKNCITSWESRLSLSNEMYILR